MEFDDDTCKIVRISISIDNHAEQMTDRCDESLGWKEGEQANFGWCVGIHIASVLHKILGPEELHDAWKAIDDSLNPESMGKIYG